MNSDTVTLSNEVKNANNPPEIIAGRMSGNVTFQNTTTGLAPRIAELFRDCNQNRLNRLVQAESHKEYI